jgi:probable addiction module antidote protein
MKKLSDDYRNKLLKRLNDPSYAVGYLNAVLEEDDPVAFLLALRDVADARGNLAGLSREAELTRESLYKILSERGNPNLNSLHSILKSLGLHLQVAAR